MKPEIYPSFQSRFFKEIVFYIGKGTKFNLNYGYVFILISFTPSSCVAPRHGSLGRRRRSIGVDFEVFLLGIFYGGENEEFAHSTPFHVGYGVGDGHDGVADFIGDITHFVLFFHGVDGLDSTFKCN